MTETKEDIIMKELEQKLKDIEEAMIATMGQMQENQMKNNRFKDKILCWLPVSRNRIQKTESDVLQLSYGLLQIQKQVFQVIKTIHIQQNTIHKCQCMKDEKPNKDDVMYN